MYVQHLENNMAQKQSKADNGPAKRFPPEAYEYNDDVSPDTVKWIRESRGVDTSDGKWKVIDALGQIVHA